MDLYLLDDNFAPDIPIDEFNSLIWTERYNSYGEVNLVISSGSIYKNQLVEGRFLRIGDSKEVMLIESVVNEKGLITITGVTLDAFLQERIVRNTWNTEKDNWKGIGSASDIITSMVNNMVIAGGLMDGGAVVPDDGPLEIIPHLVMGPAASDGPTLIVPIPFGNLYDGVKLVADLDNLGFSLYPDSIINGNYDLIFTTYRGRDLTSEQTDNKPVIFEPALDTLVDIKTLRSISGYKTVAYVYPTGANSQVQVVKVYVPGTEAFVGFKRRTMMVVASDINAADHSALDLAGLLLQEGRNALANNNYVRLTDGTIVPQIMYTYGEDYILGDVIELRGKTSDTQHARITEYIRSQDSSGEKAYPTLSVI